jgi:hypothetical protein
MNSEQDFLNKLVISKKIMEKHNAMGRSSNTDVSQTKSPMVEDYQPVQGNYNLPSELMNEVQIPQQNQMPTKDRILNSKLPDEIKQLMLEHPIEQPGMAGPTLSNDLIDKASRLMNLKGNNEQLTENTTRQQQTNKNTVGVSSNDIREIVRETVEDVLKENGLLVESSTRSDEVFKFRVGNHIFEGKLTKIKKIQK